MSKRSTRLPALLFGYVWLFVACDSRHDATSATPEPQFSRVPHAPGEIVIRRATWPSAPQVDVEWRVSDTRLAAQPAWDGLAADPPLAAHAAIQRTIDACTAMLPPTRDWIVESVALTNFGLHASTETRTVVGWCYEVTLRPADVHTYEMLKSQGKLYQLTQVVLFDGELVPQTITSLR